MKRIGIIGTGSIGRVHARHATRVGLPVVAAWDPSPEAVEAFRGEQPTAAHERNLEALLARQDVDGVVIAAPNDLHEALAVRALQAGKHVLLEKPMATTAQGCDRIAEAAASAASITPRPACTDVAACPAWAGGSPRERVRAADP